MFKQKQNVTSHLHQQVKGRPRLLTQHPELYTLCEHTHQSEDTSAVNNF